jgi:hypothetical protein
MSSIHWAGFMPKPEQQVLNAIIAWLAVKRIFAMRINTGALKMEKRFVRFGVPGMADILAFWPVYDGRGFLPVWIEVKSDIGRQSALQKSFEADVLERGHCYILARSVEGVEEFLKEIS